MAWLSVQEYAKLKGITIQAVYKQIKLSKLITKEGEQGKTFVQTDIQSDYENTKTGSTVEFIENSESKDMHKVQEFIMGLVTQLRSQYEDQLNQLENSKNNEFKILNLKNEEILKMKDEEILRLKDEVKDLKNRGLIKRIFNS